MKYKFCNIRINVTYMTLHLSQRGVEPHYLHMITETERYFVILLVVVQYINVALIELSKISGDVVWQLNLDVLSEISVDWQMILTRRKQNGVLKLIYIAVRSH